jgi:hypothetical protein
MKAKSVWSAFGILAAAAAMGGEPQSGGQGKPGSGALKLSIAPGPFRPEFEWTVLLTSPSLDNSQMERVLL